MIKFILLNLYEINAFFRYGHVFLTYREAINLMNKNITTCPLEKESAMIEDLVKIWTQFKTPTMKNLMGNIQFSFLDLIDFYTNPVSWV